MVKGYVRPLIGIPREALRPYCFHLWRTPTEKSIRKPMLIQQIAMLSRKADSRLLTS